MKFFACLLVFGCVFYVNTLKLDDVKDLFPSKEVCGRKTCEAFPWVVHIPLESRVYNPGANVKCSGALINKRYVITSENCLQFVLTKVHLGRYDITKSVTCVDKPVLKIDVEGRAVNDELGIVLLRLAEDVEFGNGINPICLPFEEIEGAEPGAEVFSSGWSKSSYHGSDVDVMKTVKQRLLTNEECKESGKIKNDSNDEDICVMREEDSDHSLCIGDEGAPVMYDNGSQWVLEGVLSILYDDHDGGGCSIKEPAVGTRITEEVLQWIVENVHA